MTRFQSRRTLATALVLAAGLLFGNAAFAQAADPGAPPAGGAAEFSTSQLQAFAAAQTEVLEITRKYQEKARAATDSAELGTLQEEMTQKQVAAVQDSGLDIGTYNSIASAAHSDPELAAKISEIGGER